MVWCGDMRTFPHRHFEVPEDPKALGRLFSVPDFVGDACKALASRVRGAVAAVTFDDFHKVLSVTSLSPPITPWSWYLFTHASPSHVTLSHCSVSQSSCVTSAYVPTFCLCDLDLLRCHQNEVPHVPMSLCCLQEPLGTSTEFPTSLFGFDKSLHVPQCHPMSPLCPLPQQPTLLTLSPNVPRCPYIPRCPLYPPCP